MGLIYMNTIYGLFDPSAQQLRYVGKTKHRLDVRLRGHFSLARSGHKSYLCKWLRSMFAKGVVPEICEIESVGEDWEEAESFWISYFKFIGADLVNTTPGGSWRPSMVHSPENIRTRSAATKAYLATPEGRAKILGHIGRLLTDPEIQRRRAASIKIARADPAYKARMSSLMKERANKPEWKEMISRLWSGRKRSAAQCEAISARQTGRKRSAESVAKSIAGLTGQKRSHEQLERIRAAAAKRRGIPMSAEAREAMKLGRMKRVRAN